MSLAIRYLAVVALFVFSGPQAAYGQGTNDGLRTGNDLLRSCQTALRVSDRPTDSRDVGMIVREGVQMGSCTGFMQGITNANLFYQDHLKGRGLYFCLPEKGISNGQAARIVVKWLQEHPEELHNDAIVLAMVAFSSAFPCRP